MLTIGYIFFLSQRLYFLNSFGIEEVGTKKHKKSELRPKKHNWNWRSPWHSLRDAQPSITPSIDGQSLPSHNPKFSQNFQNCRVFFLPLPKSPLYIRSQTLLSLSQPLNFPSPSQESNFREFLSPSFLSQRRYGSYKANR